MTDAFEEDDAGSLLLMGVQPGINAEAGLTDGYGTFVHSARPLCFEWEIGRN
jgi:hypothetical protein